MLKREFYEAVIEGNITEEVVTFAEKQLEQLSKPKRPTKAQLENEILLPQVLHLLASHSEKEPLIALEVVEALDLKTTQKATSLLGKLVKEGLAGKMKVKIEGKEKTGYFPIEEETPVLGLDF